MNSILSADHIRYFTGIRKFPGRREDHLIEEFRVCSLLVNYLPLWADTGGGALTRVHVVD